jgi:hypothetical protein
MVLARRQPAADARFDLRDVDCGRKLLGGRQAGRHLCALGADALRGLGDRAGFGEAERLVGEARAEQRDQGVDLPAASQARALRARVAVPCASEAREVGAAPVAVRGEHRADASGARVHVGADDDPVLGDALEHRLLRRLGQGVDRPAQALGGVSGRDLAHDEPRDTGCAAAAGKPGPSRHETLHRAT